MLYRHSRFEYIEQPNVCILYSSGGDWKFGTYSSPVDPFRCLNLCVCARGALPSYSSSLAFTVLQICTLYFTCERGQTPLQCTKPSVFISIRFEKTYMLGKSHYISYLGKINGVWWHPRCRWYFWGFSFFFNNTYRYSTYIWIRTTTWVHYPRPVPIYT